VKELISKGRSPNTPENIVGTMFATGDLRLDCYVLVGCDRETQT
jgi:hypothetical protein